MNFESLDDFENTLISQFETACGFESLREVSASKQREALLQRRFLSLAFTPIFDIAINGVSNAKALNVLKELICEEYPIREPSHRELLIHDLLQIEIPKEQILSSQPSLVTQKTIQDSFAVIYLNGDLQFHEIKCIAIARFWGEVLVGEEYRHLRSLLENLGLIASQSKFYWPHFEHDARNVLFASGRSSGSHADWLTVILREILDSESKILYFQKIEQKIFEIKTAFWQQFTIGVTEQIV